MDQVNIYCTYDDYSVMFHSKSGEVSVSVQGQKVLQRGRIFLNRLDGRRLALNKCVDCVRSYHDSYYTIALDFAYDEEKITVEIRVGRQGVWIILCGNAEGCAHLDGDLFWGTDMERDTFAMSEKQETGRVRCALGPAASKKDTVLYDRKKDAAFCLDSEQVRIWFDWEKRCYSCRLTAILGQETQKQGNFQFCVRRDVLARTYGISFVPINKEGVFEKPPAGWMTWYAVKFGACEESVLENLKFQEKHLKRYGADAIWIDWEWYHQDMSGIREDGCDSFHPDLKKYPHGLKYIADKIKKSGFVPALWVGFTNEPVKNEWTDKCSDILLVEKKTWCGTYFYDFSHPVYLNEYLPKALRQVLDWGYRAVKFDTLPYAIYYHEEFHDNMYNPALTTKEAFRNVIRKTREIIGKDIYMMSCAAMKDSHVLWAADLFDGARVGDDIFDWESFLKEGIGRTLHFYPLHNVVLYLDPDNVVLRDEFNTANQALTRLAFVSLLGLPMTFGDDFKVLPEERLRLIQKCLPIMDVHPMSLQESIVKEDRLIVNLAIELPYEHYNVVGIFHMGDQFCRTEISMGEDVDLDKGEYLVFDFINQKFLGCMSDRVKLELQPNESRILCIRQKRNRPQILSTSRHISQGAVEIGEMQWDEVRGMLYVSCEVLEHEPYILTVYIPQGYRFLGGNCNSWTVEKEVLTVSVLPEKTGVMEIRLLFGR